MLKSKLGKIALEELNEAAVAVAGPTEQVKSTDAVDAKALIAGSKDGDKPSDAPAAAEIPAVAELAKPEGDVPAAAINAATENAELSEEEKQAAAELEAAAASDASPAPAETAAELEAAAAATDATPVEGDTPAADAAAPDAAGDVPPAEAAATAATDVAPVEGTDPVVADATAAATDAPTDTPAADAEVPPAADPAAAAAAVPEEEKQAATDADASVAATDATPAVAEVAEIADVDSGDVEIDVVEEELEAVTELQDDSGDVEEDVTDLEAATESLEGCVSILDAAAQRGGLDHFGSALLRNNVNTVTRSLNISAIILPALEDLETPSSKIDGANTAKEQIIAFIKRIMEALKQAFAKISEWIVETYKRLTSANVAVGRRAEKLLARLEASDMVTGNIDNVALANRMAIDGKVAKPADIVKLVDSLRDIHGYLNDPKSYKDYLAVLDLSEDLLKKPEESEEIRGQISAKLSQWGSVVDQYVSGKLQAHPFSKFDQAVDKAVTVSQIPLLDNKYLFLSLPKSAEGIGAMSSRVDSASEKPAANVGNLEAFDKAEAKKLLEAIIQISKNAQASVEDVNGGLKLLQGEITKRKDTTAALSKVLLSDVINASVDGDGKASASARKAMIFVSSLFMTSAKLPVHGINRALPRTMVSALDYVAASIGAATKAEAPAA